MSTRVVKMSTMYFRFRFVTFLLLTLHSPFFSTRRRLCSLDANSRPRFAIGSANLKGVMSNRGVTSIRVGVTGGDLDTGTRSREASFDLREELFEELAGQ